MSMYVYFNPFSAEDSLLLMQYFASLVWKAGFA